MSTPASETFGQARQGSVAAIIQVLNERLSELGIRTRAVVANGMLQLLCEAAEPEQLEQQTVVSRVRQILENISPHRISRVKINSRIVKEEQLLWLEEINKDPENALLWSEIITLKRPFFVKRWIRDRNLKPAGPIFRDITEPDPNESNLSSKLISGGVIALLLLLTGWFFREDLSQLRQNSATTQAPESTELAPETQTDLPPLPGDRSADTTPQAPPSAADTLISQTPEASDNAQTAPSGSSSTNGNPPNNTGATADAFAEAIRIANQASADGQTAATSAEWLDLAARWQRASDLMAQIPSSSEQYALATERVQSYANNSQAALAEAAAQQ